MGFITEDNLVVSSGGELIGCLDAKGKVHGLDGRIQDGISVAKKKIACSMEGLPIGYVDEKGRAFNVYDQKIGAEIDGKIIDEAGEAKGWVEPQAVHTSLVEGVKIDIQIANFTAVIQERCGSTLGFVTSDNVVVSTEGNVMGHVNAKNEVIPLQSVDIRSANIKVASVVRSQDGRIIGHTAANGRAVNLEGEEIGWKQDDGYVIDQHGNVVGWVESPEYHDQSSNESEKFSDRWEPGTPGLFVDFSGNVVGLCAANGATVDANGNEVGWVQPDGAVTNTEDMVMGFHVKVQPVFDDKGIVSGYALEDGSTIEGLDIASASGMEGSLGPEWRSEGMESGYSHDGNRTSLLDKIEVGDTVTDRREGPHQQKERDKYQGVAPLGAKFSDESKPSAMGNSLDHSGGTHLEKILRIGSSQGQGSVIKDFNDAVIGYIDDDGVPTALNGSRLGHIQPSKGVVSSHEWISGHGKGQNSKDGVVPPSDSHMGRREDGDNGIVINSNATASGGTVELTVVVGKQGDIIGKVCTLQNLLDEDDNVIGNITGEHVAVGGEGFTLGVIQENAGGKHVKGPLGDSVGFISKVRICE